MAGQVPQLARFAPYAPIGDVGVGVFFVLSGFILFYNYGDVFEGGVEGGSYRQFIRRRFAKLYPNQIFTLAIIAVLAWGYGDVLAETFHARAANLPFQLTLTHGWYWERGVAFDWNQPAWSISAEWAMYLIFPLLMFWLVRRRSVGALIAAALVPFVAEMLLSLPGVRVSSGIISIMGFFPAGVVLAILLGRRRVRFPRPDLIVIVVSVALFLALGHVHNYWRLPLILLAGLLIAPVIQCRGIVKSVLASRACVFLGHASYATYMVHDIVLRVARPALAKFSVAGASPVLGSLCVLTIYGAVIAFGALTYKAVERPFERILRGRPKPSRARRLAVDVGR